MVLSSVLITTACLRMVLILVPLWKENSLILKGLKELQQLGITDWLILDFTLGQDRDFSELIALKKQASIDASITHHEIDLIKYSSNSFGFHYSFLKGLEFR